ncbi:hypothetical protein ACHAXT_003743 [Thalassiosira profunda]
MPSRKKGKKKAAKERKAAKKAEAARAPTPAATAPRPADNRPRSVMEYLNQNFGVCKHGLESDIVVGSRVEVFVRLFMNRDEDCVTQYFMDTFDDHREVWNNDAHRKLAIAALLNQGASIILGAGGANHRNPETGMSRLDHLYVAKEYAIGILLLEDHDGSGDPDEHTSTGTLDNLLKIKNFCSVAEVVRFFHRRIPCGCLQDTYKKEKKAQGGVKVGACDGCDRRMDRSTLKSCSLCKLTQYCSKECQRRHWPSHKDECAATVAEKKSQEASKKMDELTKRKERGEEVGGEEFAAAITDYFETLPDSLKNMTLGELFNKE